MKPKKKKLVSKKRHVISRKLRTHPKRARKESTMEILEIQWLQEQRGILDGMQDPAAFDGKYLLPGVRLQWESKQYFFV